MAKRAQKAKLVVRSARYADVYKDTIRLAEGDRGNLRTGRIHRFKIGGKVAYAVLRGLSPVHAGKILMDEATRDRLEVGYGSSVEVSITEASFLGQLRWGWEATDPTYATATRLGVLSFVLGILSFGLALPPIFVSIRAVAALFTQLCH